MAEKTFFRKLVRDKIPDIMRVKHKKEPHIRVLDKQEYECELLRKLQEEVDEYLKDHTPEELADILEVVYALAENIHSLSQQKLESVRCNKQQERGAFKDKIYLEYVE